MKILRTNTESFDVVILGAGLAGLSAAAILGETSVVLEKEDRPGGLVRTECFNGYWFDRVLHLLYFADPVTETRVKNILGVTLAECKPTAWVETNSGVVRYPVQMHLGGLRKRTMMNCFVDLLKARIYGTSNTPKNFEEMLQKTFGASMCNLFLVPYNRKLWKRPLNTLAPFDFQWTINQPDIMNVLKGMVHPCNEFPVYNYRGWYPRPSKNSSLRGMEVLSHALAQKTHDLRLNHTVTQIDARSRTVEVMHAKHKIRFKYRKKCLSTLPLPDTVRMCKQAPDSLRRDSRSLVHNRVLSAFFSIEGPRPTKSGHWRYYADESLVFTRLIFMHAFDPLTAPEQGWGICAEIIEPAEKPQPDSQAILSRALNDIYRVGALCPECKVIDQHLRVIDPGYVVFTPENRVIVERLKQFLMNYEIIPLGRYGRWEYSSMGQVMRDGFHTADTISGKSFTYEAHTGIDAVPPDGRFKIARI